MRALPALFVVVASCQAAHAEPAAPARPATASTAPPAIAVEAPPPDAGLLLGDAVQSTDAGGLDTPEPVTDSDAGSAVVPFVEVERPYRLWERPRPKGDVYAAGRDEELARWNLGGTGDPAFVSNRAAFHPGARVRVDTRVVGGRLPKQISSDRRTGRTPRVLSEASLLAEARRKGYWPLRLCFEQGLRHDQRLNGESVVRLTIDPRGHVVGARLLRTRLEDETVADCLVRKVRALEFSPPGRRVDVELDVKLWPGDAKVPSIGPPRDIEVDSRGKLDADGALQSLTMTIETVTRCYALALTRDGALWGRLELRIELDERGRVRRAAENESRFPDRAVVRCALDALRGAQFVAREASALRFVWALRLGKLPRLEPQSGSAVEPQH